MLLAALKAALPVRVLIASARLPRVRRWPIVAPVPYKPWQSHGRVTMTIDQMNDLEAIRQLKARYFRLMDTQQWEAWADCFTADVSAFYEGAPRANPELPVDVRCEGRAELIKGVSTLMRGAKSIHQGFMPELELTSATTARGIWAMFDYVMLPTCHFEGWGHYHEEYVKEGAAWKMKKIHLTRLYTREKFL